MTCAHATVEKSLKADVTTRVNWLSTQQRPERTHD